MIQMYLQNHQPYNVLSIESSKYQTITVPLI